MTEENKQILSQMGGGGAHSSIGFNSSLSSAPTNGASSTTSKHPSAQNTKSSSSHQSKQGKTTQQPQSAQNSKRQRKRQNDTGANGNKTNQQVQVQPQPGGGSKKKGRRPQAATESVMQNFRGPIENFNHLLGFQAQEDREYQDPYSQQSSRQERRHKRNRGYSTTTFTKEQYMQATFKFVVKPLKSVQGVSKTNSTVVAEEKRQRLALEQESRYIQYLNDPGAIVDWNDLIEVVYTPPSALTSNEKTQCPICMEPAGLMIAPRVSKCGHLFCFACILQYLDYEAEHAWKKCPLCKEPVYKRDIRKASFVFDQREKQVLTLRREQSDLTGIELQFRLVVRNKSNIVSKHKVYLSYMDGELEGGASNFEEDGMTILEAQLPKVTESQYGGTRIQICSETYIRKFLSEDLEELRRDKTVKESYNSEDQVYYLEEAIEFCENNLSRETGKLTSLSGVLQDNLNDSDQAPDTFVNLQTLNRQRSLKKQYSTKEQVVAENSDTCFYFYQVINGENLYLHPLCLDILKKDHQLSQEKQAIAQAEEGALIELPSLITGKVVEMTSGGLSAEGHARHVEFLGHLPPAASYQLVELDLSTSEPAASPEVLSHFERKLQNLAKVRTQKAAKEKKYNDRVDKTNSQKFAQMKQKVLGDAGYVFRPSQPVINYLAREQDDEEEKKMAQPVVPTREPTGFIGLDDDEDHGLERAFGGFMRKGQGGDSAIDRGGGGFAAGENMAATQSESIWAMTGGLDQLKSQAVGGYRLDAAIFDRELQATRKAEQQRKRLQSDVSAGSGGGPSLAEAVAELGFGVQFNQGSGGGNRKKKKWKKV